MAVLLYFFKWLSNSSPKYFYEFLDNSVAKGEFPDLIAKGTQGYMAIYKPELLVDIIRYQRINIMAVEPSQIYPPQASLAVENNLDFLNQCIAKIKHIDFIDRETEQTFLTVKDGSFSIINNDRFKTRLSANEFSSIISGLWPDCPG